MLKSEKTLAEAIAEIEPIFTEIVRRDGGVSGKAFVELLARSLESIGVIEFRDPMREIPDLDKLSNRQRSNVLHGRDKDDNGEFTASSMGAAQDAIQAHSRTGEGGR